MLDVATGEILQQVAQIGEARTTLIKATLNLHVTRASLGAGLPPVPAKLLSKIAVGKFIDIGELILDRVSISEPEDSGTSTSKRRTVSSILEWIKCFNVYIYGCNLPQATK